ncbi:hypothetical protein N657DRAFT_439626 [Parathielavia appendiculata]|uniref:Uncharacterized protein n=1 Tax=Parathielavia appendiculata TaxID=2587402 RepID=A0AAN6U0P1_9PEZI|nr:hypothetical protein N657DRAFT_439626 [Parathielavia appendiculata]
MIPAESCTQTQTALMGSVCLHPALGDDGKRSGLATRICSKSETESVLAGVAHEGNGSIWTLQSNGGLCSRQMKKLMSSRSSRRLRDHRVLHSARADRPC